MYKMTCVILAVTFTVFLFSCEKTPQINPEQERAVIAETISSCIGWFKEKDFNLLFSVVANDSNYVSVHPTNTVIKGFEQFEANSEIFKNPDFKYVRHELKDLTINLSQSGKVAWFYCILDDINTWAGQPANWENARWTGVLEKRQGKWRIVQQHFSFSTEQIRAEIENQ